MELDETPVIGRDVENVEHHREDANVLSSVLSDDEFVKEIARTSMTENGVKAHVSVVTSMGPAYDPVADEKESGFMKKIGVSIKGEYDGITPDDVSTGTEIREQLEQLVAEHGGAFENSEVTVSTRGNHTYIVFSLGNDPVDNTSYPSLVPGF